MPPITLRQPVLPPSADRSFWLQDIDAQSVTEPLAGSQQADIVIVGGGYTGLWTALRLREQAPEKRIMVLEAGHCGSGASGRNGGQIHSWYAEIAQLAAVVGEQEARRLCADTADSIAEIKALHDRGLIDCDLRLDGWLWTASSTAQEGAWSQAVAMTEAAGADRFRSLDADEIHRRTGSPVSYTGVVEPDAGSVHPGKLAIGLRDLAIARGVIVHENSPVLEIHPGPVCRLRCSSGEVTAPTLVLAANAWLAGIPELRQYLYIVQSQVIATAEIPQRLDKLGWRDGAAICDSQRQVLYYQRTPKGRVIFGHGSGLTAFRENFGAEFNRSTKRGRDNIAELRRVYPELADVEITHDWAGPIDCSADHLPVFDHLADHPNIFFGMGFNGTGIAQTPIAGRILASLALGSRDRWSESRLVGIGNRLKLPPEPFRYLGGRLVRAAIRRRNALEIRNERPDPITRVLSDMTPGRRPACTTDKP